MNRIFIDFHSVSFSSKHSKHVIPWNNSTLLKLKHQLKRGKKFNPVMLDEKKLEYIHNHKVIHTSDIISAGGNFLLPLLMQITEIIATITINRMIARTMKT